MTATSPANVTSTYNVTTNANGGWQVDIKTNQGAEGTWRVDAVFEGDAKYGASPSSCTFEADFDPG